MNKEKFMTYYNRVVRLIKDVIEDDDLSSEDKVRLLGVIL